MIQVAHYDPVIPVVTVNPTLTCGKASVKMDFETPPPGVSYTWTAQKMYPCYGSACVINGTNAGTASFILTNGEKAGFQITATDGCGSSTTGLIYELIGSGNCPGAPIYYLDYDGPLLRQFSGGAPDRINLPEADLRVLPNPAHGDWTVSLLSNNITQATLILYDMTGRQVYRQQYEGLSQHDLTVPNQNLPTGSYFLEVKTNIEAYYYKLIKI